MKSRKSKALSLELKEVMDPEFVKEVLDRKLGMQTTPRAQLLRSSTSATLVRKKVLAAFPSKAGSVARLSDLASHTPFELKGMANLGNGKVFRWLEEYLQLLGVVLPETKSVHGMSQEARAFLASL